VEILAPYCHFDIPGISQAYILFRARLAPPYTFAAQQPESLDARLFAPHEIPFEEVGRAPSVCNMPTGPFVCMVRGPFVCIVPAGRRSSSCPI
jgi:hypothetical protein